MQQSALETPAVEENSDYANKASDTTRLIKSTLRKQFPQCKFSVTHGGERITWTDDGPTKTDVEDAIIATGLVEISQYDDGRYLQLPGKFGRKFGIFFDRYNEAERAAREQDQERQRAIWEESRQREQQEANKRAAEASRTLQLLWDPQDIPSIPLFAQLYGWVVEQNEKRLPKWKFRIADDLAVQIHPRITRAHELLFECIALQAPGVTAKMLIERDHRHWRMGFRLSADAADAAMWRFKPTRMTSGERSDQFAFRQRVVAALHPDHFANLSPDLMLEAHCLACGRPLTDPVSMARWIGPECWGSASTNLPRIFKATGQEA
jgi:hypothetical protein